MRRFHLFGAALMIPTLVIFLAGLGCGGGSKDGGGGGAGTGGGGGTGSGGTAGREKTAIEAKGVATLKGKVTYDGDPPKLPDYKAQMQGQKDKEVCLAGDTSNQTWKVKNGAVANVVVWIKVPPGKFFQLPSDVTNLNGKDVVLDQPHCA